MTWNRLKFPACAAFCAPLALAIAVGAWGKVYQAPAGAIADATHLARISPSPHLQPVRVSNAGELKRLFDALDYTWPPAPGPSVPRVAVDYLPDDFAWPIDLQDKKNMFFKILLPLALAENQRVLRQRERLTAAISAIRHEALPADHDACRTLEALAQDYRVDGDPADPSVQQALLDRIDAIPVALILAQAANESGWGDSRFAREGNNLFGLWTYLPESGIVPADRPDGETYLVRRYSTLQASVRSYILNLNIGHAYDELRTARATMRAHGDSHDPLALAAGLERYSIRGEAYVEEIRAIIRVNDLDRLARADLRDTAAAVALAPPARSVNLQLAATRVD
jgi:Bax protein